MQEEKKINTEMGMFTVSEMVNYRDIHAPQQKKLTAKINRLLKIQKNDPTAQAMIYDETIGKVIKGNISIAIDQAIKDYHVSLQMVAKMGVIYREFLTNRPLVVIRYSFFSLLT